MPAESARELSKEAADRPRVSPRTLDRLGKSAARSYVGDLVGVSGTDMFLRKTVGPNYIGRIRL